MDPRSEVLLRQAELFEGPLLLAGLPADDLLGQLPEAHGWSWHAGDQAALEARPNAFFSVNAVGRKPHKRQADTNPYVRKFLGQIRWKPQQIEVFGGKIEYPRYGFLDRNMIRLIMWITGGPTDPRSVTDFTDWAQVEAFARRLVR